MRLSIPVKSALGLSLPFFIWCWLYRELIAGNATINEDTFAIYAVVKYFLANLTSGVFPHWNPLIHWGMGVVCQVGEFNPLWLLTLLLNILPGIDFYHAFILTIVLYFWLGCIGMYALMRHFFQAPFTAYLGYILFLFSGLGMTVFTQVTMVFIFVPTVWFFYFLVRFFHCGRMSALLGAAFAVMIALTTYIPFYFVIVTSVAAGLSAILYPRVWGELVRKTSGAARRYPSVFIFAGIGIAIALLQGVLNWMFLKADFDSLARPAIMTYKMVKNSGIHIDEIARDTSLFHALLWPVNISILSQARDIFTLTEIFSTDQRIFYAPVLTHLIIFAACFVRLNRRMVLWGGCAFILFLMALAGLTPVYQTLFENVKFFSMFRNIFFLTPFIIGAYIFLGLEIWESFWLRQPGRKWTYAVGAVILIAAYVWYWYYPGYFLTSSVIVSAGFLIVCALRFTGVAAPDAIWIKVILMALALTGPAEVISSHAGKFQKNASPIIEKAVQEPLKGLRFAYTRPSVPLMESQTPLETYHLYNLHIIAMKDEPGNVFAYGYAPRWTQDAARASPSIFGFAEYARHKFAVYDRFNSEPVKQPLDLQGAFEGSQAPEYIYEDGQGIQVNTFNANQAHVTTSFTTPKFLVYNDSYHPQWRVSVNGRPAELVRANYAFKGVWVPAGTHQVHFDFEPFMGAWLVKFVLVFFYIFCAAWLWLALRRV